MHGPLHGISLQLFQRDKPVRIPSPTLSLEHHCRARSPSGRVLTYHSNFFFGPLGLFAFGTATLPQESFASYGNAGTPSVDTIQYFWAVNRSSSDSSIWTANPGHETIPPNWYNRPTALSFAEIFAETSQLYAEAGYPAFGGNVGKTDSFVGLTFEAGGIENGVLKDPSAEGIACLFQQVLVDSKCLILILWTPLAFLSLRFRNDRDA
jgi:hypothetical protein